ncbi:MAG: PAS-domain containing protein, partial [Pseudomonadota bacterium]
MSSFAVIVSVGAYGAALFALAWWADQSRRAPSGQMASGQTTNGRAPAGSAALFGLSIAVYCTSWTYYGAVGTAQTAGLDYLPIYLGPFLVFTIGRPFLRRLVVRGKSIHSTSIADFLSAHYGKSRTLAALVTIIAIVGALPYIALQLKSVAATYGFLTTGEAVERVGLSSVGPVAVILALFAVMFGTRHVDITRHNRGMIAAVAFDSVIKLLGLLGVGLFAWFLVRANPATPIPAPLSLGAVQWDRFAILTLLSMGAIICLPRQFHVTVVECEDHRAIDRAAQVFLVYLVLISAVVVPIVMAAAVTPRLAGTPADLTVLALPSVYGADILALCVFVGGFAAATGMVIVACVALSTMITTDLVAPALLHRRQAGPAMGIPGKKLLNIRRVSIVILMMAATGFAAFAPQGEQLASLGVLSFAAVAHYLPALVGALYWKRANAKAAIVSMAIGFALWAVLLFLPSYFGDEWFGLFPGFGIIEVGGAAPDRLTYGVVMSLGVNALIFVGMSLWHTRPARANAPSKGPAPNQAASPTTISAGDLYTLVRQCLGAREADQKITAFEAERGRTPDPERIAGPRLIAFVNQEISKTVGASSANILLKSAFAGDRLHLDDVATLLGETTGRVQFSQELLQTTLENISHGVSVVDGDLRLVAWNAAYVAMYDYPAAMIVRGRPIEDLIRHNAERGECGPGETERHVARRLAHLRAGNRHSFERTRPNGSVVRIEGIQTTGGAYVTTYTDVSDYKRIEKALTDSERSVRFYTDNIPVMASYIDGNEVIRFA